EVQTERWLAARNTYVRRPLPLVSSPVEAWLDGVRKAQLPLSRSLVRPLSRIAAADQVREAWKSFQVGDASAFEVTRALESLFRIDGFDPRREGTGVVISTEGRQPLARRARTRFSGLKRLTFDPKKWLEAPAQFYGETMTVIGALETALTGKLRITEH